METENISTNIYLSKSASLRGNEADAAIHAPVIVSVASVSETAQSTRPSLRGGEADEAIQNRSISQENAVTGLPRACGARNDGVSYRKPNRRVATIIGNILFYLTLVAILIAGLAYGSQNGRSIFGYSMFTVLSGSMEREIPEGSLIIVKRVEPESIKIGDDITYIREDNSTVTHRVMTIYENYENSGVRGFVTKGIDNPEDDPSVIHPDNVIGVVQFHVSNIGAILSYISANVWIIAGGFVLLLLLSITLRMFFNEVKRDKARNGKKSKHRMATPP
jgi:signal peptidase